MKQLSLLKFVMGTLIIWACSGGGDGGSPTEPVNPQPTAPSAENINVTTNEDTPTVITLKGADVNNAPLSFSITKQAAQGTFTLSGNSGTYTPNANINGTDEIQYVVSNGTATSTVATLAITINPVDDDPESIDITVTTDEDTPTSFTLEANEYDGDDITFQIDETTQYGTLSLDGNQASYIPNAHWFGVENFTFSVFDSNDRSIKTGNGTIVVNSINDTPSSYDIYDIVAPYNEVTAIPLGGDDDDGDNLAFELYTEPTKGNITVSNDTAYFSPTVGLGADTFEYRAYDGSAYSDPGTVYLDISNPNQISISHDIDNDNFIRFEGLNDGSLVFAGAKQNEETTLLVYKVLNNKIVNQVEILTSTDGGEAYPAWIIQNNNGNIMIFCKGFIYELDNDLTNVNTAAVDSSVNAFSEFKQLSNGHYFFFNGDKKLFTESFDEVVTGFEGATENLLYHDSFYYRITTDDNGWWLEKYNDSFNIVTEKKFIAVRMSNPHLFVADNKVVILTNFNGENYGYMYDLDLNHLLTKQLYRGYADALYSSSNYNQFRQVDDGFIYLINDRDYGEYYGAIVKINNNLNFEFVSTSRHTDFGQRRYVLSTPNAYIYANSRSYYINLSYVTKLGNRMSFD